MRYRLGTKHEIDRVIDYLLGLDEAWSDLNVNHMMVTTVDGISEHYVLTTTTYWEEYDSAHPNSPLVNQIFTHNLALFHTGEVYELSYDEVSILRNMTAVELGISQHLPSPEDMVKHIEAKKQQELHQNSYTGEDYINDLF